MYLNILYIINKNLLIHSLKYDFEKEIINSLQ